MEPSQSLTAMSSCASMDELRSFIRIEKCPLCERTAKNFYCRLCVRTGDFGHSRDQIPTRFADRKLQLFRLKHEIINYAIAVEDATEARRRRVQQLEREAAARRRLRLLQAALAERRARVLHLQAQLEATRRAADLMRDRQPRMRARLDELRARHESSHVGTRRLSERLQIVRHALKGNVRGNVRQVVSVVFPVSEVAPRPGLGRPPAAMTETESALAEAQSLAYVRGRWVRLEHAGELQYRVVEPTLPGSGDYSAYHLWAASNQEAVPAPAGGSGSPVHNLAAALTYTAQLLNVIAFYMDVRPRNRLCYSEFCRVEMTEREFNHRVAKLNANLVCLCLHAGVEPALLEPRRTAYNLTLLLAGELRGGGGVVRPPDALVASMEESLRADLDFSDPLEAAEQAARPSPADDEPDTDWEQVSHEAVAGGALDGPGSASVAAGLVSTAAASVASFLRGFNR